MVWTSLNVEMDLDEQLKQLTAIPVTHSIFFYCCSFFRAEQHCPGMQLQFMWRLFVRYKSLWCFRLSLFSLCANSSKAHLNLTQHLMPTQLAIQLIPDIEELKLIESLKVSTLAAPPHLLWFLWLINMLFLLLHRLRTLIQTSWDINADWD